MTSVPNEACFGESLLFDDYKDINAFITSAEDFVYKCPVPKLDTDLLAYKEELINLYNQLIEKVLELSEKIHLVKNEINNHHKIIDEMIKTRDQCEETLSEATINSNPNFVRITLLDSVYKDLFQYVRMMSNILVDVRIRLEADDFKFSDKN